MYNCGNNPGKENQESGIAIGKSNAIKIYNNIIYNSSKYGIVTWGDIADPTFDVNINNNIISGTTQYNISVNEFGHTNISSDNNIFDRATGKFGYWDGTSYDDIQSWRRTDDNNPDNDQDTNSIVSDPHFINPSLKDFHLEPDSPAIDAGVPVDRTQDFDGNLITGLPDIGVFEYIPPESHKTIPAAIMFLLLMKQ